jgi:hypothetical protein
MKPWPNIICPVDIACPLANPCLAQTQPQPKAHARARSVMTFRALLAPLNASILLIVLAASASPLTPPTPAFPSVFAIFKSAFFTTCSVSADFS